MIYNDLSPLKDKFENIVKELFLDWKSAVLVDFPELIIDLKDIQELIMDVKGIIDDAITEIAEKKETLNSIFAKVSYFHGFVQERLNTCWHFNYIFKQTNEFKIISLLRTIGDFLEKDPFTANKIADFYMENILEETNFTNFDPKISVTNDEIILEMEYPESKSSGKSKENPVIMGTKNIYAKMVNDLDQFNPQMYIPKNIHDYILPQDVRALIDLNIQGE